jgi:hypothetical protein
MGSTMAETADNIVSLPGGAAPTSTRRKRSAAPADPTGPLRSRRARKKRKTAPKTVNPGNSEVAKKPNDFKPSDTVIAARSEPNPVREKLYVAAGAAIGLIACAATALSLSDLADAVQTVAHTPDWKSYALAIALDANFIATEAFSLFASETVAKATRNATTCTKIVTLVMSAVANSYAMAHTADGALMQGACIAAGCAIPALIAMATFTLGRAARA